MLNDLIASGFRRAGHRARRSARCLLVGTVTDPTVSLRALREINKTPLGWQGLRLEKIRMIQ